MGSDAEFLLVSEAAEMARVSVWTIRRWIASGKLIAHRPGHRVLVAREELKRMVTESRATTK